MNQYLTKDISELSDKEIVEITSVIPGSDVWVYPEFCKGKVKRVDRYNENAVVVLEDDDEEKIYHLNDLRASFNTPLPINENMYGISIRVSNEDVENISDNNIRIFETFHPANIDDYLFGTDEDKDIKDYLNKYFKST